tara:strand:- start:556 stop:1002 length:447 start_codon:yes stop_codon:yes gene_type:complete
MKNNPPSGPVADAILDLVVDMGYTLLEFSSQHVKGRTHVHCVLSGPNGVDLDSLTQIHRALQPRLEELLDDRDLRIEFSSPGMERTLKSFHECVAFVGHRITLLPADSDDWLNGTIASADTGRCEIDLDNGEKRTFTPDALTKVRLVD